ncbi:MAG: cyclic nucleotide-binding domain-containing protein [Synergistaceae bacterium]|nr:cyclic nucleotide-binding domain-containing protein [Synergistaceae bacterium]
MLIGRQKELAKRQRELEERRRKSAERQKELEERKKKLAERQRELDELEHAYQQGNFQLFVVCGAEGAGKTMLIQGFCDWKRRMFLKSTGKDITTLQNFADTVMKHYEKPRSQPLTSWDSVFKFIADSEQGSRMGQRLVLVLSEFPDPSRRDDQFMKMFKSAVDQYLSRTKIFLIVSSSDTEFVQKYFLDEGALLHENMNGFIRVEPLSENITLDDATAEKMADEAARTVKGISNARMKIHKITADEVILREGETNSSIYRIITGSAVCWFKYGTDDEYVLASMADGDCFGEYSALTDNPNIYTVVAFSDMLIMEITKDDLITFVEMNAKNAIDIMSNTARMLNVMAVNIEMLRSEYPS